MKTITKTEERELQSIARQINDRERTIQQLKFKAFEACSSAVTEAVMQGQDLLKAKAIVGHGNWINWVAANCPRSASSCEDYMKLAKYSYSGRAQNLGEATSLRQALMICEKPEQIESLPKRDWLPFMEGMNRFGRAVQFLRDLPIEKWPPPGREELREKLEPVAKQLWPDKFIA